MGWLWRKAQCLVLGHDLSIRALAGGCVVRCLRCGMAAVTQDRPFG